MLFVFWKLIVNILNRFYFCFDVFLWNWSHSRIRKCVQNLELCYGCFRILLCKEFNYQEFLVLIIRHPRNDVILHARLVIDNEHTLTLLTLDLLKYYILDYALNKAMGFVKPYYWSTENIYDDKGGKHVCYIIKINKNTQDVWKLM